MTIKSKCQMPKPQSLLQKYLQVDSITHQRRQWQPTPVFLPGESQGQGSLVGCHLWGRTESDTTVVTWQQQQQQHPSSFNPKKNSSVPSPYALIFLLLASLPREGNGTPTPVLLPGKSHGLRSLVGCSPWGH